MQQSLLFLIWTSCKRRRLTITGIDSCRHLSDSWNSFTKFTPLKKSQEIHVVRRKTDKNSNDYETRSCSLKYGPKLGKPLRIEKNKNGKNEKPKLDDARRLRGIYFLIRMTLNAKKPLKMREETWTGLLTQPCRAKKGFTSNRKLVAEATASHKVPKTIYGCTVETHESTRQRVEPSPLEKNTKITSQVKDLLR